MREPKAGATHQTKSRSSGLFSKQIQTETKERQAAGQMSGLKTNRKCGSQKPELPTR